MKKNNQTQELLLEQLKKTPIVAMSCEKIGISRATYYDWRKKDAAFAKEADKALRDGTALINDAAESQLIAGIKAGNLTSIIFWLKNKHPDYKQPTLQSGFAVAQDSDQNLYFELFGKLKPETKRLIEPYLQLNENNHGQQETK